MFIGPLQTFPENFMQIHAEVFAQLLTNRQQQLHIFFGGGKNAY